MNHKPSLLKRSITAAPLLVASLCAPFSAHAIYIPKPIDAAPIADAIENLETAETYDSLQQECGTLSELYEKNNKRLFAYAATIWTARQHGVAGNPGRVTAAYSAEGKRTQSLQLSIRDAFDTAESRIATEWPNQNKALCEKDALPPVNSWHTLTNQQFKEMLQYRPTR